MCENSRVIFNDRLGSKICIIKQMGVVGGLEIGGIGKPKYAVSASNFVA